ncbi:MAG: HepT-like ribonuclease domain-containing protein [Eubacteriales bacterium]|nr:HepT-like ribonuclease domain-containing protein [Eubacteriales bacterium]
MPWKAIAGMRDITAHKYQTLRMEDVYNTVKIDFPVLKQQFQNLLNSKSDI